MLVKTKNRYMGSVENSLVLHVNDTDIVATVIQISDDNMIYKLVIVEPHRTIEYYTIIDNSNYSPLQCYLNSTNIPTALAIEYYEEDIQTIIMEAVIDDDLDFIFITNIIDILDNAKKHTTRIG